MECRIDEVAVHYVEHGSGVPLVALHGAGVDHREIEAAIEAIVPSAGYRRIYPDLPGEGPHGDRRPDLQPRCGDAAR
jgi:pimeloyl-ACP methyl ester carboxylesterase